MSISYRNYALTSLSSFVDSHTNNDQINSSTPSYAHPVDGWIIQSLNSLPVKAIMNKSIDVLVSFQFGHNMINSVCIDTITYPDLFKLIVHCAKTLSIPIPHVVIQQTADFFNAFTAGTDDYQFINVSAGLVKYFSAEEISFVIGHECGHIASGHMVYHTLASALSNSIAGSMGALAGPLQIIAGIPLSAWSRRSEITADRAGLLCCGDIKVAEKALLHLVAGVLDLQNINIDDYLENANKVREYHSIGKIHEFFESHPIIPKRIKALRLFANSEMYYQLSGKPIPENCRLYTDEELNSYISQLIRP